MQTEVDRHSGYILLGMVNHFMEGNKVRFPGVEVIHCFKKMELPHQYHLEKHQDRDGDVCKNF